jgi:hypothetical protein
VIVNNSLKGYDEFARLALRAPYSARPSSSGSITPSTASPRAGRFISKAGSARHARSGSSSTTSRPHELPSALQFPQPPKSNGALEFVRDYLERIHPARVMARSIAEPEEIAASLPDADYFLLSLAEAGYVITKIED